ncbi:MAG: flavodoxin family protein [Planctomycetota bacterium]|jgi:hypothetical protein
MDDKGTLVVYYSRTGTTRSVAELVAGLAGADLEEVVDTRSRRGVLGFLRSGMGVWLRRWTPIEPVRHDPADYRLVVVGTPVWAFSVSTPIRTYLCQQEGRLGEVAFFCVRRALGAGRAFRHMAGLCGHRPRATLALRMREVSRGDPAAKVRGFLDRLDA